MNPVEADVRCPHCQRVNELHADTGIGGPMRPPRTGDVALCWGCGMLSVFSMRDGQLSQRLPTEDEAKEFATDPELVSVMARMALARTYDQQGDN